MNTPRKLLASDLILLILTAFAVGILFLKEPGLGDDFTYWRTAWAVHENGIDGWSPTKFHDLRWPIWGFCWVLQGIFGPGLVSFYGVPFSYLSLGSLVIFILGNRVFDSRAAGWACALTFLFHPLLDTVIFRPMPDLTEGVLIGVAVLCWLGIVENETRRARVLFALGAGLVSAILFANRITGVFVFGVLAAVALVTCWRNPRFKPIQALTWLAVIGVVWLALVCVESLIYQRITGDFLHSLHTNMGAKGRKGTESVPVWTLPFRFLRVVWAKGLLGPTLCILAVIGAVHLCRREGRSGMWGRVITAWAVALYLAYSCSLQSVSPPRPLLRDADRFLCSLSIPLSILSVAGAGFLLSFWRIGAGWIRRNPVPAACLAVIFFCAATRRSYFNLGYVPQFRAYLQTVPAGTSIFTHDAMRSAAYLSDARKASTLQWNTRSKIFHKNDKLEEMAAASEQFWFCRKLTWLTDRQDIQREKIEEQNELGSFFTKPQLNWSLTRVINIGEVPEFIFYQKRDAAASAPEPIEAQTLFAEAPAMPFLWEGDGGETVVKRVKIPEVLRNKPISLELNGSANFVQAIRVQLKFFRDSKFLQTMELRPYFHRRSGIDFHRLQVPEGADTCEVTIRVSPKARKIALEHLLIVPESPQEPLPGR